VDSSSGQSVRPSSAEPGAATRSAILTAAIELITEVGWGQVTTRAIAERAGVPHGAVSYHFHGKAELLREAGIFATRQVLGEPIALVGSAGSAWEVVEGTFGWYAMGGLRDPSVTLLLEVLREAARDEVLRATVAEILREYRAGLARLVRADQEAGTVNRDVDPEALARLVAALFDGLLLHATLDPDIDIEGTAAAVRTLLGGR
jgi:AcrR family transcriptional regulator